MEREPVFLEDEGGGLELARLRESAATALEAALGFVEKHGGALAQLRARVALQATPREALVAAVADRQAVDGSFAPLGLRSQGAFGFDSVDANSRYLGCLEALAVLADANALYAPPVSGIERFLREQQGAHGNGNGAWGGVFETGMLAGFLGKTTVVRPAVLEAAAAFLIEHFSPDAVEADWPTLSAYAHFFTNVHHDAADDILQWCGRATEKAFLARRADGVATVRILLYCDAAALPGASLDPVELLERMLAEQARDGGFAELAGGGPAARVAPTLDALVAIPRICQAL